MALPLQAATRPTFWQISPLGKAIFYYLSTVAILVFLVGVYGRFARYARASEDPFPRLDDIGERVLAAARIALTNQQQFDRDWVAGLWHSFVFWGFLTLLIGTTILGIDMDLYRPLTGESFCRRFLPLVLLRDGPDGAAVRGGSRYRHLAALRRPHGPALGPPHRQLRPPARLVALPPGRRRLPHRGRPDPRHLGDAGRQLRDGELRRLDRRPRVRGTGRYAGPRDGGVPLVWWSHSLLALWFVAWIPYAKPFHMLSSFANVVTRDEKAGVRLPGVPADAAPEDIGPSEIDDFSRKQLLDQDACTKCGRCSDACPAKDVGRSLDPRTSSWT